MHNRDSFPDETPVADAVEQEQATTVEPTAADRDLPPVEADPSDWHEQRQEIVDDDREEYRD
jgi:hypothetical protein